MPLEDCIGKIPKQTRAVSDDSYSASTAIKLIVICNKIECLYTIYIHGGLEHEHVKCKMFPLF